TIGNSPPVLSGGAVSPTTGDGSTLFTYTVTYTDTNNDPPISIWVFVDNDKSQPMRAKDQGDTDYIDGKVYVVTARGLTKGDHTFKFAANDGVDDATGDVGIYDGPSVYPLPPKTIPARPTPPNQVPPDGGVSLPPPPIPGITDVADYVDIRGMFTLNVSAKSADNRVELTIGKGTIGKTKTGERITQISIIPMEDPLAPPANSTVIGLNYDLGPDGATFTPSITITFNYDPNDIPEGVNEKDLVIAMWDEDAGEWVELEGIVVDPATHTITAQVDHLTVFSVLAYTRPAAFTVKPAPTPPKEINWWIIGGIVTIVVAISTTLWKTLGRQSGWL
ncbi:MAG: hypothetical protein KAV87_04720, partial [Desulfobacteraceae bacterium]|nr:hypothetical protein [Desulfobacteraceae bacterium]